MLNKSAKIADIISSHRDTHSLLNREYGTGLETRRELGWNIAMQLQGPKSSICIKIKSTCSQQLESFGIVDTETDGGVMEVEASATTTSDETG